MRATETTLKKLYLELVERSPKDYESFKRIAIKHIVIVHKVRH